MSTPQQPWSPSQPGPAQPPQGYGTPQWYAGPQSPPAPPAQPGQPGQPGQQPPQPFGGAATGELVVNLTKPVGAMGMISPVVTIDGHPAPSTWGRNSFTVPAGVRQVEVAQTYFRVYGNASLAVSVGAGHSVDVYYAGPMATVGLAGAIGLEPQRRPGRAFFVGVMVFLALLLLIVVLAVVLGNS